MEMTEATPIIGITMGDPAGVGPEIICMSLAAMPPEERCNMRVYGNLDSLAQAAGYTGMDIRFMAEEDHDGKSEIVAVHHNEIVGGTIPPGKLNLRAGEACFRFIKAAVRDAEADRIACIVTAPINKEALNGAGHHYDGHTGMLTALTRAPSSFMLLASERLSILHVSTHVSLLQAIERATTQRVLVTIRAGFEHLRRLGLEAPRIAVAGLNPHCGENGLFGNEDNLTVAPAVSLAQNEGIDVQGPIPADTVYHRAYNGAFDLVIAMYHDQGHIPIKLVAFDTAVNVTLGLPIDRTSVDHGTAFDIAGRGIAKSINLDHAIKYAQRLTAHPKAGKGN